MKYGILRHTFNCVFLFFLHPYSKDWDSALTKIITEGEIKDSSECTITFCVGSNIYKVWVAGKYYSFGHIYEINSMPVKRELYRRPSFKTMRALSSIVDNQERLRELAREEEIRSMKDKVNKAVRL